MTIERALELLPQMRDSEWITALGQKTALYTDEAKEAFNMAISALEKQEQNRWRPCNEKPEYDFQNVLVRWHDKRKGCEKDYYIFEGYVVRGIWCGLFEDVDISDLEPIEWKPLEPYMEEES